MTLDEAIRHAEEVADGHDRIKRIKAVTLEECRCAEEHRQLAEWLKDYKRLLEQEPCEDAISRKSLKQKLQEHYDFFVNAYGEFSNLPRNDKSRVDEISNCIAMVINEPPVTPQQKRGQWLNGELIPNDIIGHWYAECSECGKVRIVDNDCPNCGVKMVESQESEVTDADSN